MWVSLEMNAWTDAAVGIDSDDVQIILGASTGTEDMNTATTRATEVTAVSLRSFFYEGRNSSTLLW